MSTAEGLAVLLVAESIDPRRGGQERSVFEYASELRARGAAVTLLAGGTGDAPEGCGLIRIEVAAPRRSTRWRRFARAAVQVIGERRAGAVVQTMVPLRGAHVYLPRSGLCPEVFRQSRSTRTTAVGRGLSAIGQRLDGRRRLLLAAERAILEDPAGPLLVALSDAVALSAEEHYGLRPPRVRVVRNGVDVAGLRARVAGRNGLRAELGIPEDAVIFVAAAHNFRRKGIPELCAAARLLPIDVPWAILIAGREKPLRGVARRVKFLGAVADAARLLDLADVVVNPTHFDPASRVVLEGLALGRPVLTTRQDGAADQVGEAGIVLESARDPALIAAGLSRFLDASARGVFRTAAAGRGTAVSMERHTDEMIAVLNEVRG